MKRRTAPVESRRRRFIVNWARIIAQREIFGNAQSVGKLRAFVLK